jgi:hypothetical protein
MNDEPIDFSPLDPSRDPHRWQSRLDGIVADALRSRQRRLSLIGQLQYFARPALAIAAAFALVSWVVAAQSSAHAPPRATVQPATNLLKWAANDEVPSASEVLESLGVQNVGQ